MTAFSAVIVPITSDQGKENTLCFAENSSASTLLGCLESLSYHALVAGSPQNIFSHFS